MSVKSMTAEEAAEVIEIHRGEAHIFMLGDKSKQAFEVAIARLRSNCGNCHHFSVIRSIEDGDEGQCQGQTCWVAVPADGSGGCTHAFKAKEQA